MKGPSIHSPDTVERSVEKGVRDGMIIVESPLRGVQLVDIGEPLEGVSMRDWVSAHGVVAIHTWQIENASRNVEEACPFDLWART